MKNTILKLLSVLLTAISVSLVILTPTSLRGLVLASENEDEKEPYARYRHSQLHVCSGEVRFQILDRHPQNYPMTEISFKSSNESIVKVFQESGFTLGIKPGDATITVTCVSPTPTDDYTSVTPIRVLYADVCSQSVKDYWYDPVYHLTNKKVVDGYKGKSDSGYIQYTFRPDNSCTRAQMVTFLWRLSGEPGSKVVNPFKDIKPSDYFYKAVLWATEKKVTTGTTKTTFDPQAPCTRAQTVTFLWRMAGKPEPKSSKSKFKDIKPIDYFYKAAIWGNENGVVYGKTKNTFNPQGKCTRKQMVTFLYRYDTKVLKNKDLSILDSNRGIL